MALELELRLLEPGGDTDELRQVENRHGEVLAGRGFQLRLPRVEREMTERTRCDDRVGTGLLCLFDRLDQLAERSLLTRLDDREATALDLGRVIDRRSAACLDDPFEVLLMRRVDTSSFVPGAWVFPGGMVEDKDHKLAEAMGRPAELDTMKVCAIRELLEESGLWLGEPLRDHDARRLALLEGRTTFEQVAGSAALPLDRLVWTARWITPAGVPKRFDTYFFLVAVPRDVSATPDEREGMEMLWIAPSEALQRERRGELKLVFPTIKNLEAIASFRSAADLLGARRGVDVPTTRPILVVEGKERRIVLPESGRS